MAKTVKWTQEINKLYYADIIDNTSGIDFDTVAEIDLDFSVQLFMPNRVYQLQYNSTEEAIADLTPILEEYYCVH